MNKDTRASFGSVRLPIIESSIIAVDLGRFGASDGKGIRGLWMGDFWVSLCRDIHHTFLSRAGGLVSPRKEFFRMCYIVITWRFFSLIFKFWGCLLLIFSSFGLVSYGTARFLGDDG